MPGAMGDHQARQRGAKKKPSTGLGLPGLRCARLYIKHKHNSINSIPLYDMEIVDSLHRMNLKQIAMEGIYIFGREYYVHGTPIRMKFEALIA